MLKEVNIKKVREEAEEIFRLGGFYCSEAIISSIRKNIDPTMPLELVSAGSGFPIGVGRSRCLCGAISGAVVCLGYFFGRTRPTSPDDPDSEKCLKLTNELQESFRQNHKTLCCHIHIEGLDIANGEHRPQCIAFTGECAQKAAEIIARELGIKLVYEEPKVL